MAEELASYPSGLPPLVLFDGYSEQPRVPMVAYPVDSGRPIIRPRTSVRMHDVSCGIDCTYEQTQLFEDWFWYTLGRGVKRFNFMHPRREHNVKAGFSDPANPYQIAPNGPGYFKITMTLLLYL